LGQKSYGTQLIKELSQRKPAYISISSHPELPNKMKIAQLKPPKLEMVMSVFDETNVVFSIVCTDGGFHIQSFPTK